MIKFHFHRSWMDSFLNASWTKSDELLLLCVIERRYWIRKHAEKYLILGRKKNIVIRKKSEKEECEINCQIKLVEMCFVLWTNKWNAFTRIFVWKKNLCTTILLGRYMGCICVRWNEENFRDKVSVCVRVLVVNYILKSRCLLEIIHYPFKLGPRLTW